METVDTGNDLRQILIWDCPSEFSMEPEKTILLWQSFYEQNSSSIISIPNLVEKYSVELRASYLAWVYKLGEKRWASKTIIEHLNIRPDLSFWWMTLLAEKCNYSKSPQIDDAIRVLALEKWLSNRKVNEVVIATSNAELAEIIKKWCLRRQISFEWRKTIVKSDEEKKGLRRYIKRKIPRHLFALGWLLKRVLTQWPLKGIGTDDWQKLDADICMVSYSSNLVSSAASVGNFESLYWSTLPETLQVAGIKTRWINIWAKDKAIPDQRTAKKIIERFNNVDRGHRVHVFLDSFSNSRVILRVLRDWLVLLRASMFLEKVMAHQDNPGFNLWPLARNDWRASLKGPIAVSNILMLNLFEEAFGKIPRQKKGVYLQENQGWEPGLISSWRKTGHGDLIGVPHSTLRFWDLRYSADSRLYTDNRKMKMPLPNYIAANGPVSRAALQEGGYPSENIIDVEALRYLNFKGTEVYELKKRKPGQKIKLLVLGDWLESNNFLQMKLLEAFVFDTDEDIEITVKSHPSTPILKEHWTGIDFNISNAPIEQLLKECDVAYTSSSTSAAIDAYCAGVPVVSVLDGRKLNLSPLRRQSCVWFVCSANEIKEAITQIRLGCVRKEKRTQYFNLNASLPFWKSILIQNKD